MFSLENFSAMPFAILAFLAMVGALLLSIISSYTKRLRNQRLMKKAMAAPPRYLDNVDPEAQLAEEGEEDEEPAPELDGVWDHIRDVIARSIHLSRDYFHRASVFIGARSADERQSEIFVRALDVLTKHFGPKGQYKLPWYLYVGAAESGKSTVLESLDLDLPIGKPIFEEDDKKPDLKWWFFNRAVVIDVRGDYLLPQAGQGLSRAWGSLLINLNRFRTKRPIDGIILSISCEDLIGEKALSHDVIIDRAKRIHTKLWELQSSLSIKTPIYVTLTKADLIPGYRGFAAALPPEKADQILGWSCPFSLDTAYTPQWADRIFETFDETLNDIRAELYGFKAVGEVTADPFVFKVELQKMKDRLAAYLNNIFHESNYHDSFFLRGVYLTGDVAHHTAVGEYRRQEQYRIPPQSLGYAIETPFSEYDARKSSFINELFENKIFREYILGRPIKSVLISTNKLLLSMQAAMATFLALWCGGLFFAFAPLQDTSETLLPLLVEANETMNNVLFKKFDLSNDTDVAYLNDQSLKVLKLMQNASAQSTGSVFIPATWAGLLDKKIKLALTETWNRVILYAFHGSLKQKANKLFIPIDISKDAQESRQVYINPVQSPEFEALYTYVREVIQFERSIKKFNDLEKNQDMKDVGLLVKYLYNYDLANSFYFNDTLYRGALKYTRDTTINTHDFVNVARRKFDALAEAFRQVAFDPRRSIGDIERMRMEFERLKSISESRRNESADHAEGTALIMRVAQSLDSKDFKWIEQNSFAPGPEFSELISLAANSRIIGIQVADRFLDTLNAQFIQYKQKLKDIRIPEIGHLVLTEGDDNEVKAKPSLSYESFVNGLKRFLEQSYMEPIRKPARLRDIDGDKFMVWDRATLERAVAMVEKFEDYIVNETIDLPDTHRILLEHIGRVSVRQHIFDALGKSQSFREKIANPSQIEIEEGLFQEIKQLKDIHPLLRKTVDKSYIVAAIGDDVAHMKKIMVQYGEGLLQQVELLLEKDALYAINEEAFNVWNGRDLLGLAAFGAFDLEEVQKYLAAQRDRVSFIAKNFAAPVLSFLNLRFLESAPKNMALMRRWENILNQIEEYEKASPNNTIKKLEQFIQYDLNRITGSACLSLIEAAPQKGTSQDFFIEARNMLRARVVDRCTQIVKSRARKNYLAIAQYFNNYISNRFPFTADPKSIGTREVDPQDLKTLIELYDLMTDGEKRAIRMFYDQPGLRETPANFLLQMDHVMPFLKAAIGYVGVGESESPKILFNVNFDARKSSEQGREYIVERIVDVANRPIASKDSSHQGEWTINDTVKVKFRWANGQNSSRVPRKDVDQPALEIEDGRTAVFTYQGRWSLLKMMRTHATSIKENNPAQPLTLKFEIPTSITQLEGDDNSENLPNILRTARVSFATLYVDMYMLTATSVQSADSGGVPPEPLAFPIFPFRAPLLENFEADADRAERIMEFANNDVRR